MRAGPCQKLRDFMRILFVGDVFGEAGRDALFHGLYKIKKREKIDFCVVNGENSAKNGRGMSGRDARDIFESGADVITMGNHVWGCPEFEEYADRLSVLRPGNLGKNRPGRGFMRVDVAGTPVGVINIEGRAFIDPPGDSPFEFAEAAVEALRGAGVRVILVDIHAEATSEKKIMALFLDGRVSAVVGTHTHVQTADECVLDGGTAFITDVGMTGISRESVLGMGFKGVYERYALGRQARFEPLKAGTPEIDAVVIDVDEVTGKALTIKRIKETVTE